MAYCVYVLLCDDGSFYTGHTRNLESRFRVHVKGKGARYTKTHKPKKIIYSEECASRSEAMKRERTIKKLSHMQKLRLAKSNEHGGKETAGKKEGSRVRRACSAGSRCQ